MIAGQDVIIRSRVSGVVCGKTVALRATSRVEGDVHHVSLAIERGAVFEDAAVALRTRLASMRSLRERAVNRQIC